MNLILHKISQSQGIRIVLMLILAFIVLSFRFLVDAHQSVGVFVARFGYWLTLAGVAVYLYNIWLSVKNRLIKVAVWKHRKGLLLAIAGSVFLQVNEPRRFKVLFDEFAISGVARNMHYTREASFSGKAHNVNDRLEVFGVGVDKRPILFPFAISCLHDILGYRPQNVFILNGFATFGLLFVTYYFGAQFGGFRLGAACMGLWLMLPLLAQCATSGGYDVLNLFMLGLVWCLACAYLNSGDIRLQNVFILTVLHLAQVRYESILYVIPAAVIILVRWVRQREISMTWITVVAPLFLLLPMLINYVYVHTPNAFQTDEGQSFFGIRYLSENVWRAISYLFDASLTTTNSFLLASTGVLTLGVLVVRKMMAWKANWGNTSFPVVAIFGAMIIINTVFVLCNFWGQWDDAMASRFSLPMHYLFILAFGWTAGDFFKGRLIPWWLPPMIYVMAIAVSVPAAAQNRATRSMWQGPEYTWLLEQLEKPEHRGALVVSHTLGPIVFGYPAIDLQVAENSKWKINECIKQRIYPEILVLERLAYDYDTMSERPYNEDRSLDFKKMDTFPEGTTALSKAFKRETVAELRLRANVASRLSRITAVEGSEAVPPETYLEEKPPFKDADSYYKHIYSILP